MNREKRHTVVAPAVLPIKSSHGHQLNVRHAKLGQVIELPSRGIECALRRKGSDVQFIDDRAFKRSA